MSSVVFVGPTLTRAEVAAIIDADCLPPVVQGDVYRAARGRPRAIGIIDGHFCGAPSVWHKEILWAISQGIPVFGSASMGALRAAELHAFGMCGIGRIFEAFRDGLIEDDDEVALVHGPAEADFVPLSEPMVNIRATLERAEGEGILSRRTRLALEAFAKALHFPRRSWSALLDPAAAHGVAEAEIAALRAWLPKGAVDQKRIDAIAMLRAMKEASATSAPAGTGFHFEQTFYWDELTARVAVQPPEAVGQDSLRRQIIEELRLQGAMTYEEVRRRALLRFLACAGLPASQPQPEAVRLQFYRLRERLGLFTRAALEAWLEDNDLDGAALQRLLEGEARLAAAMEWAAPMLESLLIEELVFSGAYEELARRARRKIDVLGRHPCGPQPPDPVALRAWYFTTRCRRPLPDDVAAAAAELGFASLPDFDGALRREWLFCQGAVA